MIETQEQTEKIKKWEYADFIHQTTSFDQKYYFSFIELSLTLLSLNVTCSKTTRCVCSINESSAGLGGGMQSVRSDRARNLGVGVPENVTEN